jgi:fimbrial chaperone protein
MGKEPIKIQVRVFRWVDRSNPKALEPTTDLVASPPIAVMKPLVNYSVRIIRQINEPVEKETAYRMLIDVLPNDPLGTMSVGMGFQYSLPIYVQPSGAAKQKIDWSVERDADNIIVSATNNGTVSAQFRDLKVSDGKSNIDLGVKAAVTLGPGDTQSWTKAVPKSFNAPPAQITGKLGDKPFKASAGAVQ